MTVILDPRTCGRNRIGRRKHGYWVPDHMRADDRTCSTIQKVCKKCGLDAPHGRRSDRRDQPRDLCIGCSAQAIREWREKNWQRVKLRDTWRGMNDRCHNPERMKRWAASASVAGSWRDYGAAGVSVCDRWRGPEGLENFTQDVGDPPSKADTLDRINPHLGYFCGKCPFCSAVGVTAINVRWSSKAVQDANRKNSKFLEGKDPETGETLSLTIGEWARRLNLSRSCLQMRLRRGWPLEKALVGADSDVPF